MGGRYWAADPGSGLLDASACLCCVCCQIHALLRYASARLDLPLLTLLFLAVCYLRLVVLWVCEFLLPKHRHSKVLLMVSVMVEQLKQVVRPANYLYLHYLHQGDSRAHFALNLELEMRLNCSEPLGLADRFVVAFPISSVVLFA